ncbi:MAG: hypothetical protein HY028_09115 [Gammaproteobacteria bacterium]|nr:hypothetical protein [Gammaproteobacteria bacterium]
MTKEFAVIALFMLRCPDTLGSVMRLCSCETGALNCGVAALGVEPQGF